MICLSQPNSAYQLGFASPKVLKAKGFAKKSPEGTEPPRALNAYNIFFRYQRTKILLSDQNFNPEEFMRDLDEGSLEEQEQMVRSMLKKSVNLCTVKGRRPHRKTHGKVAFTDLSKFVSQAWKSADDATRSIFTNLAKEDKERYDRELRKMCTQNQEASYLVSFQAKKTCGQKRKRGKSQPTESILPVQAKKKFSPVRNTSCGSVGHYAILESDENHNPFESCIDFKVTAKGHAKKNLDQELYDFLSELDWSLF